MREAIGATDGGRHAARRSFWKRFRRARLATPSAVVVAVIVLAALAAGQLAPYNPVHGHLADALQAPSWRHLLGTDSLGRDELSRVVYGARVSLLAGVLSVGLACAVGIPVGLLAGYLLGAVDEVSMRIIDAILAFPSLVLALAISAALGPGLDGAMLAIGFVTIPRFARLTRGQVLSVREREYVEGARAVGVPTPALLARHVFPNVVPPLIVQASLSIAFAILTEASLSFLGLGVQPPTPSWGSMLLAGKDYLTQASWLSLAPGAAIFLTVMAFNLLGDAFDEALDPRRAGHVAR